MTDEPPKPPPKPEKPASTGNRVFTTEEMRAAFGRHPWADWKPEIKRKRRRR
jgi:hypothetical protein